MEFKISQLEHFVNNPEEEIKNIRSSFGDHVKLVGTEKYRPRIVFYNFFGDKMFGVVSRPYVDETDYYSCLAEMMYSYSALDSKSCILVLDSYLTKNNQNIGNALNCYFISSEKARIVSLPYKFEAERQVSWLPNSEITEIDMKSYSGPYSTMLELLYSFSHLDDAPFNMTELLSYYSSMGYLFRPFKELQVNYIEYKQKQ